MFLHVCVILFIEGGAIPACIAGGIPACLAAGLGGGCAIPACIAGGIPACLAAGLRGGAWSWGVCSGGLLQGSAPGEVPGGDPPRTATAAGGTHPTGMHSCWTSERNRGWNSNGTRDFCDWHMLLT